MKLLIALLASISTVNTCGAQGIQPTTIKGHEIGESAEDFFSKAGHSELLTTCQEKKQKPDKKTCEAVRGALAGMRVETTDPKWKRTDSAILSGRKLVRVHMTFALPMAEVLPDLENKYGKASSFSVEKSQNGYGATWEVGRAFWDMPDGTVISAIESVSFLGSLGYVHFVDVELRSKEEASNDARRNEGRHIQL